MKHNFKDMTGEVFKNMAVLEYVDTDNHGNARWLCLCRCGREVIKAGNSIRNNPDRKCIFCSHRGKIYKKNYY